MWYEWIFSGIGTTILSALGGLVLGGICGYKIGVRNKVKQTQKAKECSKQRQELDFDTFNFEKEGSKNENNLRQIQKAGTKADQTQIGKIK